MLNCRIFRTANISNRFSSANWKSYPHIEKPSWRYVDMFSSAYGRIFSYRKSAHAQTENQESSTSERGARVSYRTMFPEISTWASLLEPRFRYLSPGSEGEKCRALYHMRQTPFIHSARFLISSYFYIYVTVLKLFPPFGTSSLSQNSANLTISHAVLQKHSFQSSKLSLTSRFVVHGTCCCILKQSRCHLRMRMLK